MGNHSSSTSQNNSFQSSVSAKANLLAEMVGHSIDHAKKNRLYNSKRASIIRIVTIIASTLVTIFLGLQIDKAQVYFQPIAFILGALVTLLNALEPFFNYRALWIEHEQALAEFYEIKNDLDFYLSGTKPNDLDLKVLDKFRERHWLVWNHLHRSWIEHRKNGKLK